jgi:hypothetical protein
LYIDDLPDSYKRIALAPGEGRRLLGSSIKITEQGTHTIKIGDVKPIHVRD